MTSNTPAILIESRLRSDWTTTAIYTEDEVPQPPQPPASFVMLEFPGGASQQWTIGDPGNNVWREDGSFMIHVFVPITGDPSHPGSPGFVARDYAEQISQIFRGQVIAPSLIFYAPQPPHESERVNGNYWGISFGIPYSFQFIA